MFKCYLTGVPGFEGSVVGVLEFNGAQALVVSQSGVIRWVPVTNDGIRCVHPQVGELAGVGRQIAEDEKRDAEITAFSKGVGAQNASKR